MLRFKSIMPMQSALTLMENGDEADTCSDWLGECSPLGPEMGGIF